MSVTRSIPVGNGLCGNDGNRRWKQKHIKYCQVTKVTSIFNKLQHFSSVFYASKKAEVFVSVQKNCFSGLFLKLTKYVCNL